LSAAPPDIFLSYAHQDLEWVRPLAAELERRGWRVFWDQRVPAGRSWRGHIGTRLESARCVIVVWSEFALKAKFVLQEADIGLEREVLLPVLRQPVRPLLGFREVHAANLARWRPGEPSPEFETFIADLRELLGSSPVVAAPLESTPPPAKVVIEMPAAPIASEQPASALPALDTDAAPTRESKPAAPTPPPEPPSSTSAEPVTAPDHAAAADAGVTREPEAVTPSPEPPPSASPALDIPTAPAQRPDPAPEAPAATPPLGHAVTDPTNVRPE
jgi:hypothetical protein